MSGRRDFKNTFQVASLLSCCIFSKTFVTYRMLCYEKLHQLSAVQGLTGSLGVTALRFHRRNTGSILAADTAEKRKKIKCPAMERTRAGNPVTETVQPQLSHLSDGEHRMKITLRKTNMARTSLIRTCRALNCDPPRAS